MTYSVEDHVDAMQQRSAELWKERLAMLKEANDRKRAEKKRRKEMENKGRRDHQFYQSQYIAVNQMCTLHTVSKLCIYILP